ncbi:MAG: DUF1893 domain-containing protein [candidate division WOR-3 bacterium]
MDAPPPYDGDLLDRLRDEKAALLVLQADRLLFRSMAPGVKPLLELVDRFPQGIPGATAVDRMVGACAARVFVMLQFGRVVAETMSAPGREILVQADMPFSFRRLIPEVRNRDNTDVCPFEKMSGQHSETPGLIQAIRRRFGLNA